MGLRALRSFFSNAPGRAAAGRRVCVCRPAARARFVGAPRAWPSRGFPAPFSVLSALERGRLAGLRVGLRGSAVVEPCGRFCRGAGVCGPWWFSLFLSRAVPLLSPCLLVLVWAGLFRFFPSLPVLSSCVAGWSRRRSVFQEGAFLGYVPFGTGRVTMGGGLVQVSAASRGAGRFAPGGAFRGFALGCPPFSLPPKTGTGTECCSIGCGMGFSLLRLWSGAASC